MNDYKIIIDAAHGGQDYGETLKNFEEKDYCLYLSKQLVIALKKENLNVQTTREKDINLEPSKRIEKIRKMITNSNKTIILSIHSHFDNEFTNIIDSKNDTTNLANIIYKNLKKENIKVIEPTIKILPANWNQDYYYIQREININPTIIPIIAPTITCVGVCPNTSTNFSETWTPVNPGVSINLFKNMISL